MMLTPRCPDHGSLALDLACGRLDVDEAVRAERVCSDCEFCAAWWSENLEGQAVAAVHAAVGEVVTSFEARRQRRPRAWWAAAAAAVVVLSVGLTWRLGPSTSSTGAPPTASSDSATAAAVPLSGFDFESGRAVESRRSAQLLPQTNRAANAGSEEDPEKTVFVGSFESGDLEVWTPKT